MDYSYTYKEVGNVNNDISNVICTKQELDAMYLEVEKIRPGSCFNGRYTFNFYEGVKYSERKLLKTITR